MYRGIDTRVLWYTIPAMAISIKSMETERLAREIAERTGDSLTGAIQKALEERLDRLKQQRRSQILASQLEEILHRVDQLPILDSRTPDEILGYDEHGLPR
jgi:antitoxin VapB